jgi:NADH:ubiquinone oxidoreductase subunit 5 (subunit L)/multisubunit Na+/H+ antiporter MnhA subunit
MNLHDLISNVHWIPVIVLTIFSFVIGFLWHQPILFGKSWKNENNPDNIPVKINAPLIFGGTAIVHFIAIMGLSAIISGQGAGNGLLTGFLVSFVWILPAMTGTYLFANRSIKLLAIDGGMYIVLFSLCGLILGIW